MTSAQKVYNGVRSLRQLRRTLKPHPGHFRGLVASILRNLARLVSYGIWARLAGRRVAVIGLPERLGDIVACTPFAARHRRSNPRDLIVWAARSPYLEVLRGNHDVDALMPLYCITDWAIICKIINKFNNFGILYFDLLISPNHCEKCRYFYRSEVESHGVSWDTYYDFGPLLAAHSRASGFPLAEGVPSVSPGARARASADRLGLPQAYVCIHALAEDDRRNWDACSWNDLIDYINNVYNLCVVEVGLRSPLGRLEDGGYHNLCGRTGLAETTEVIRRSRLYVGIDSGPAHLANAVRTPAVILLGRFMSWDSYMPYTGFFADARNCQIVRHRGPVGEMPLNLCLRAVDRFLSEAQVQSTTPEVREATVPAPGAGADGASGAAR